MECWSKSSAAISAYTLPWNVGRADQVISGTGRSIIQASTSETSAVSAFFNVVQVFGVTFGTDHEGVFFPGRISINETGSTIEDLEPGAGIHTSFFLNFNILERR